MWPSPGHIHTCSNPVLLVLPGCGGGGGAGSRLPLGRVQQVETGCLVELGTCYLLVSGGTGLWLRNTSTCLTRSPEWRRWCRGRPFLPHSTPVQSVFLCIPCLAQPTGCIGGDRAKQLELREQTISGHLSPSRKLTYLSFSWLEAGQCLLCWLCSLYLAGALESKVGTGKLSPVWPTQGPVAPCTSDACVPPCLLFFVGLFLLLLFSGVIDKTAEGREVRPE
jgi:hypothetical protein